MEYALSEACLTESTPKVESAKRLPENWKWRHYNDGSGCLLSPDEKKRFFSYDLAPYCSSGWIEYQIYPPEGRYDIFFDGFSDFKDFAEDFVLKKIIGETS